jgi:hypothetical protein
MSSFSAPPILILAFNRPSHLRRLISSLRKIKPPVVYCAQDGPRPYKESDKENCKKVKAIWNEIDWKCKKYFLIREQNLGCQRGVSEAISWFFEHEESGIILEDDCLPSSSFFLYCKTLLHHYKNDPRIMHISGDSFIPSSQLSSNTKRASYRFSQYPHCWGWATWKRAWKHFDRTMKEWPTLRDRHWLQQRFTSPFSRLYWAKMFNGVYTRKIDSWAIAWVYTCWIQQGLAILPNTNLVTNIGFDSASTHTNDPNSPFAHLKVHELDFPLTHPKKVIRDMQSDAYDQRHVYEQFTPQQLFSFTSRKIKSLLHIS